MILLILAIISLILTGILFAIYYMAFYTNRRRHPGADDMPSGSQYEPYATQLVENVRRLQQVPYEPVEIISHDGLRLFGRYYNAGKGAPVVIMFHGYRSNAYRDASGGAPFCMKRGFSVLLVDQRAHGKSEGHTITFGVKERRDCLDWIKYVIGREGDGVRILLMGVSMGAATVLMASDLDLPDNVKGIAADCGYSAPEAIIHRVAGNMGAPVRIVKPLIRLSARLFGRFDLMESDAVRAAANFRVPVLLIHGDDDRFVPCSMSREIYAANPQQTRLVEIPGAGHGIAYYVNRSEYERAAGEMCEIVYGC